MEDYTVLSTSTTETSLTITVHLSFNSHFFDLDSSQPDQ
jgi:hypothetical protein